MKCPYCKAETKTNICPSCKAYIPIPTQEEDVVEKKGIKRFKKERK